MTTIDLIHAAIEEAVKRNVILPEPVSNRGILRLDIHSFNEFNKYLKEKAEVSSYKEVNFSMYNGLDLRCEREQWENKLYIEIEEP